MADRVCYNAPYLPASFKGARVDAVEVSSEHGRRGAEGEFPFGETTAYADLGRRIRTYSLSGRFVTNNHNGEAALFIAACESPGPGILVHPTRGVITAACKSCKVSDNIIEGQGETTVDCEFVEANDWISGFAFGASILNIISTVALIAAAFASFDERYTPRKSRYFRIRNVTRRARDGVAAIRNQFVSVTRDSLDRNVARAISDFDTVIADEAIFTDTKRTHEIIELGMAAVASYSEGDAKYEAMRALANWAAQDVSEIGIAGQSIDVLLATFRIVAAAYMTDAVLELEPETVSDGLVQRMAILTILQIEIDAARERCDNNLHIALIKFAGEADYVLMRRALELPALIEYNFHGSSHSLVAAYEIYGDAKRFRDIERRNQSSYPWMLRPRTIASVQA